MPSAGMCTAARARALTSGSSSRAVSPLTRSASQPLARACETRWSSPASSFLVSATHSVPIRSQGVSSDAHSASQPGAERVTSSASSVPGVQSAPQVAMPVLPFDAPSPTSWAASTSATRAEVSESRRAMAQPTTPPPTMTTS